ncbi:MAG: hypothetical protein JNL25_15825 [Rhodospirillaceae bacterium]|nr:hypothetical protein [Rhodospirillaceae bacterium]
MTRRIRQILVVLLAVALLHSTLSVAEAEAAAPPCAMDCDMDTSGMGPPVPDQDRSGADCMVDMACFTPCAKLPAHAATAGEPVLLQAPTFAVVPERVYQTTAPLPEPSPPKQIV